MESPTMSPDPSHIAANTGKKRSNPPHLGRSHHVPLRWRVTSAPDPTPPGRSSANRPRRGRPRKYPLSDREKKQQDEVSIIPWRAPLPVYEDLPPGGQVVPWSRQWPEIIQYYLWNSDYLDISGRNLYSPSRYKATTGSFMNAFHTSPGTLTLRILFAEASRPDRRASLQRMLWLKGEALNLVNEGLRDPVRKLSSSALSDIVTLFNYEQVWGSASVARLHRKGLRQLIDLMGGIDHLTGEAATLVPMILWSDRSRQALRLFDPTEDPPEYPTDFHPGLQPLHPLNLALLPPDRLSTPAGRKHAIGISILSPAVRLMVVLDGLKHLCAGAAHCHRVGDPPQMANPLQKKLTQAEGALVVMRRRQSSRKDRQAKDTEIDDDDGESAFFSSPKYRLQQLMFESARLAGLMIAHAVNANFLDRTASARQGLEDTVALAEAMDLEPLLPYYPRILLWLVFVYGSFYPREGGSDMRGSYAQLAGRACAKIGLESWEQVRGTLQGVYFYPEVQEAVCEKFWGETSQVYGEQDLVGHVKESPDGDTVRNEVWGRYYRAST